MNLVALRSMLVSVKLVFSKWQLTSLKFCIWYRVIANTKFIGTMLQTSFALVRKRGESYFHSQVFSEKFPSVSTSASKTPTALFRDASLPVDDVL